VFLCREVVFNQILEQGDGDLAVVLGESGETRRALPRESPSW
jgi:hypothetical protein